MAPATRDRAVEAAVDLVGAEGVRALTHARVDERAGLPRGSTSNWFRTRRALLSGVLDWISERELEDLAPVATRTSQGHAGLIEGLCAVAELQIEPFAARTRARYALFLELAGDPELGQRLRAQHREFQQWTEQTVTTAGIADPVTTSRALMALMDGLMLHRLILDPGLDMRGAIERAVTALAQA
ncbi:MAG TPA: TetR family transcriptional regulator C-terminal domain-containing protein [Nocardioides sp.]|jgi:DNA-binding transcriptional regulator YbjK|uniref:TetR/AcrR family transcriptional regulator n=1 Tax=Nocardioides sp. TaxID=35761 RepID=UPI002E32F1A0|nr:TetR family transcriptional regulator C-terminal domain-containing protein [Nocardioides sp.]HEX5088035.1 TetR family transcriptional regulator C-terminal domain-containing protein [Nocardioides sp.]